MNKIAPVSIKLKVLKSCVTNALLYNCETFGSLIPDGLEQMYFRMLRAALGVRTNCPNLTLLIETGFLPLQCMVHCRQIKFFRRFKSSLQPNGTRAVVFDYLLESPTKYLKHYVDLDQKYEDVSTLVTEQVEKIKSTVRSRGSNRDAHYKFWIYCQINPELKPSPFLQRIEKVGKSITKFRLGSHNLPIETGRWCRTLREDRLCNTCGVLGDENHVLYNCSEIPRDGLGQLPQPISSLWESAEVNRLFKRICDANYID